MAAKIQAKLDLIAPSIGPVFSVPSDFEDQKVHLGSAAGSHSPAVLTPINIGSHTGANLSRPSRGPFRTCLGSREALWCTMRFGSTAKVLLKCKLKYYRISECGGVRACLSGSHYAFQCASLSGSRHPCSIIMYQATCCHLNFCLSCQGTLDRFPLKLKSSHIPEGPWFQIYQDRPM